MAEVELVAASALDYEAFADLQRRAFAQLLTRRGVSDAYLRPDYFQWKFNPPAGEAQIAIARDGGEMVAANAMIPLAVRRGAVRARAWQSCDTATSPKARGKGLFQGCLAALHAALSPGDLFFGFPNAQSTRGFERAGWRELALVHTWVAPLPRLLSRTSPRARPISSAGSAHDALSERLLGMGARPEVAVEHDAAFLDWRYFRHPVARYEALLAGDAAAPEGSAIVRFTEIGARRVALAMELSATTARGERELLLHLKARAAEAGRPWFVLLDSALPLATGFGAGLVPVWSRLLPKRQVLMGIATDDDPAPALLAGPWRVQTGDWDVF
jgi:hypothetical protein